MSKKTRNTGLVLGASPRADLLPPDLKIESKLRRERRGLIFIAVLSVIVVALAYGFATFKAANSVIQLASATANTNLLLEQQKQYSEVTVLNGRLKAITDAQLLGVSTEIDWQEFLGLVQKSLPSGATIKSISAVTAGPGSGLVAAGSPLGAVSIASLDFVATTSTLPDVSAWIDNLAKLKGFADATAGSIVLNPGGTYSVTIQMHINTDALANRFSAVEEEEDDAAVDDVDADDAENEEEAAQ